MEEARYNYSNAVLSLDARLIHLSNLYTVSPVKNKGAPKIFTLSHALFSFFLSTQPGRCRQQPERVGRILGIPHPLSAAEF
jgi:hypothetical protein